LPLPSWIALSLDGKLLYTNREIVDWGPEKAGSVTAYAIDVASGNLTRLNTVSSGGAGPAYIQIHPSGKFALVANYHGGTFA
jgi:6-phosphogluconolactonase